MNDQDRKDLQEFRALYAALSEGGKTNNALFNAMLNECRYPWRVFVALMAFPKEAAT